MRVSSDHHAIALNHSAYPSVNHVAFEMPSIDAFMRQDTELSDQVRERDDEVDGLNRQVYRELLALRALGHE